MNNLIEKRNIGPQHPRFIEGHGNFTQVMVVLKGNEAVEEKVIAIFVGAVAKTFANKFIASL